MLSYSTAAKQHKTWQIWMTVAGNFAWCSPALWLQHQRNEHMHVGNLLLTEGHTDLLDFNPEPHTFNTLSRSLRHVRIRITET